MSTPFEFKTDRLTFDSLIDELKKSVSARPGNEWTVYDERCCLISLLRFFTQSPSFLGFQRDMERKKGGNNASSLFGVFKIPTDAEIRKLMDPVDPHPFFPLFVQAFQQLVAAGALDKYRTAQGKLLLSLDGVYYFSSKTIHCDQCSG